MNSASQMQLASWRAQMSECSRFDLAALQGIQNARKTLAASKTSSTAAHNALLHATQRSVQAHRAAF